MVDWAALRSKWRCTALAGRRGLRAPTADGSGRRRTLLVAVLLALPLLAAGAASVALAAPPPISVAITAPSPTMIGDLVHVTGKLSSVAEGGSLVLELRRGGSWTPMQRRAGVEAASFRFTLRARVAGPMVLRVRASRGGRTYVGNQLRVIVRARGVHAVPRKGTVMLPGNLHEVAGRPADDPMLLITGGVKTPPLGSVVIAPRTVESPVPIVGKVTRVVSTPIGARAVRIRPARLTDAYRELRVAVRKPLVGLKPRALSLTGRASGIAPVNLQRVELTCSGSTSGVTATADFTSTRVDFNLNLAAPSIHLLITSQPKLRFSIGVGGAYTCTLPLGGSWWIPLSAGVGIQLEPKLELTASGRLSLDWTWLPRFAVGFDHGPGIHQQINGFGSSQDVRVNAVAGLSLFAGLQVSLTVGRGTQAGVGGALGAYLTGSVASGNCIAFEGAVKAALVAHARVFLASWHFTIAQGVFARKSLGRFCAGSGGGGGGGGGGGDPAPPPALPAPAFSAVATPGAIALSWRPVAGATAYRVFLDGTPHATVTGTSATVRGLLCGLQYMVGVQTIASGRTSAISQREEAAPCARGGPANLHIRNITQDGFDLGWDPVPGFDQYALFLNGEYLFSVGGTSFPYAYGSCGERYTVGVAAERWNKSARTTVTTAVVTNAPCPKPTGAPPVIRRIDGTAGALNSPAVWITISFSDPECDVVGGVWEGATGSGLSARFSREDPALMRSLTCAGGEGSFRFARTCGAAEGRWTEYMTLLDAGRNSSPRFEFTYRCTAVDITAPWLQLPIGVSPTSIDVGDAPGIVTLTIRASDDRSGIDGGNWTVSYGEGSSSSGNLEPTPDPAVWVARVHVWRGAPSGTWSLTTLGLRDRAGNISGWGFAPGHTSFQVSSTPTAPDFTLDVSDAPIILGPGALSADSEVTIRVTGNLSGAIVVSYGFAPGFTRFGFTIGPPFPTVDAAACAASGGVCRIPFRIRIDEGQAPGQYPMWFQARHGERLRADDLDIIVTAR